MLKVVELFAGVGGFRLGLESSGPFEVVWSNQWEPATKEQHAFNCYARKFNSGTHVNDDIAKVYKEIPEHDVLVGGFPCQDYSVARTLSGEKGLEGKKGVLFWEIMKVVNERKPHYVLLENVDRMLKSPSKQRGRDFSIMLASFRDAGYYVEWRVINAAEYGFPQRRRRVFIFAYHKSTLFAKQQEQLTKEAVLHEKGFFIRQFPVLEEGSPKHEDLNKMLPNDIVKVSDTFSARYRNSGVMMNGEIFSRELIPVTDSIQTLGQVLEEANRIQGLVDEKYYLKADNVNKKGRSAYEEMQYQKGSKKVKRTSNTGHEYFYSEGSMSFPDILDKPGRTMLTSEGTSNRSSHVVEDLNTKRIRFLTPLECELLNGFPPNWTEGMPERKRYFCMGNALVVGLIGKMGKTILEIQEEANTLQYQQQIEWSV